MLDLDDRQFLADAACRAARAAGRLIHGSRPRRIERKEGGQSEASQVVTEVDRRSQGLILEALQEGTQRFSLGVLSEELDDDGSRFQNEFFWSIDPLDGTLSYVEGRPGYAVSIALVSRTGIPEIGVIVNPTSDTLYCAIRDGGVTRDGRPWSPPALEAKRGLRVFVDRSFADMAGCAAVTAHLDALSMELGGKKAEVVIGGGAVMNACQALGQPPACYFKFPKAEEGGGALWDFAATACLFAEAGAPATDMGGRALDLNRADGTWMNQRGVLFATSSSLAARITEIHRSWRKAGVPGRPEPGEV